MSRARHRAKGGSVDSEKEKSKPVWEAGSGTNEAKESEEGKKRGGKVHKVDGEMAKHRADRPKRARGGGVGEHHHAVKAMSMKHHHGMHVPGRKQGGGIGANRTPLSTAARVKHITPGEGPEEGMKDKGE
jgi:hypothetical protein